MLDRSHDSPELTGTIRAHVEQLCSAGDRDLGTDRNRAATAYVAGVMGDLGFDVEELSFEVPEWRHGVGIVPPQAVAHLG